MNIKFPKYVVREIFRRVARNAVEKNNSSGLLMNSRCDVCGDKKSRMYLTETSGNYHVYCHKCNYSVPFYTYLVEKHPEEVDSLKEHIVAAFKDSIEYADKVARFKKRTEKVAEFYSKTDEILRNYLNTYAFPLMNSQSSMQYESFRVRCIQVFEKRKIPIEIYKDFWCFHRGNYKGYVAIPFFDPKGRYLIEHIQGMRMFKPLPGEEGYYPKYKFLKDVDVALELKEKPFWGTWRLDLTKPIMVVEGTLDAMAFYNGISTCTASLSITFLDEVSRTFPNRIWAVDNYWIDPAGRLLTDKLLSRGEKCFIIPQNVRMPDGDHVKDGNDLLQALNISIIPPDYVAQNTFSGKMGLARLRMMINDSSSYTKVFDDSSV
jgi:hypothetical protein